MAYCLVGVKNKWVHISLSSAYLASLAVTVLIDYVMSPPISDGIQGAYFVGIFMTGLIFGAGSLIFKEVTEGFGCLLGGFCISMWFLTLKPGGLITSQTGKGIFIAIFCALFWSLSFSHYTRAYGLIGSTAFSGATAFVLGVDCFSRAGLKEFWFYIWELNDDLFPLGTTSYPMTRGIRVEIIIIILGTIIGVISQIKLWKMVRDKQKKKEEARQDEARRKDVVEQALGRQLERQNDKDRSNWEKQYGNSLQSKRSTVLWSHAHPDQSYTHIPNLNKRSSSSESLEMATYGAKRQSRLKRQSSATVESIPEEGEDAEARTSLERQKAWTALQEANSKDGNASSIITTSPINAPPEVVPLPFKIPNGTETTTSEMTPPVKPGSPTLLQEPKRASKRQSLQSMLSLSPRLSSEKLQPSESQEALILPESNHSRPSSVAATLDEENDLAEMGKLQDRSLDEPPTPKIVVSPAASVEDLHEKSQEIDLSDQGLVDAPPSPPALSVSFDFDDPEELARPVEQKQIASKQRDNLGAEIKDKRLSKKTKGSSSESGAKQSSDSYANSHISTEQTTASEVLTKGLLDQVPSQMSNVVMSYRTNEWAKHISTAEAPVFDEPDTIEGMEDEAPTQLAPPPPSEATLPSEEALDSSKRLAASSKPPAPHVMSSGPSGNVVAHVPLPPQRSMSDQSLGKVATTVPPRPAQLTRPSSSKGKRSSSGTGGMKPSLASTPIDENVPTEFMSTQASQRRQSVGKPQRVLSNSSLGGYSSRPATAQGSQMYSLNRANSYMSMDDSNLRLSRSSSVMSNAQAIRSETRLGSYESRQPSKREHKNEAHRREQLLAEWRMSQQQGAHINVVPKDAVNSRRAQMLQDKEHKKLMEDQERAVQLQKQSQIDQVMRRPDMQDLHREAMRKMQANASKKL